LRLYGTLVCMSKMLSHTHLILN